MITPLSEQRMAAVSAAAAAVDDWWRRTYRPLLTLITVSAANS